MSTAQKTDATLLAARIQEADKRFKAGHFGYGYLSDEPWFEEDGLLIKVLHGKAYDKPVLLEARVGFVNGSAEFAHSRVMNVTEAISEDPNWEPMFTRWRHGGWYVHGISHINGGCGCVSNNYEDGKWRVVCDPRRSALHEEGDFTFKTRNEAAHAERALIRDQVLEMLKRRTSTSTSTGALAAAS